MLAMNITCFVAFFHGQLCCHSFIAATHPSGQPSSARNASIDSKGVMAWIQLEVAELEGGPMAWPLAGCFLVSNIQEKKHHHSLESLGKLLFCFVGWLDLRLELLWIIIVSFDDETCSLKSPFLGDTSGGFLGTRYVNVCHQHVSRWGS